jgi:hypothetical protein
MGRQWIYHWIKIHFMELFVRTVNKSSGEREGDLTLRENDAKWNFRGMNTACQRRYIVGEDFLEMKPIKSLPCSAVVKLQNILLILNLITDWDGESTWHPPFANAHVNVTELSGLGSFTIQSDPWPSQWSLQRSTLQPAFNLITIWMYHG